jgi:hypothetical protein
MIIYNVTCKIAAAREEEWLKWMRETHVPEVCKVGEFVHATLLKLKFPVDDDGVTYAVQYHSPSMQLLDKYLTDSAPAMQVDHMLKFGEDVTAFRTILETVGEYGAIKSE